MSVWKIPKYGKWKKKKKQDAEEQALCSQLFFLKSGCKKKTVS